MIFQKMIFVSVFRFISVFHGLILVLRRQTMSQLLQMWSIIAAPWPSFIKNSTDMLLMFFFAFNLKLCVLFRFCSWSIWMWRTAAALQSLQLNSPMPALAVSLLLFLRRRNHSVPSSRSSSKNHTLCSLSVAPFTRSVQRGFNAPLTRLTGLYKQHRHGMGFRVAPPIARL